MAELKTQATDANVEEFLETVADDARRQDCRRVLEIMKSATGEEPRMWGAGIVGFGSYHYRYESGREGDWFLTGFSPRKGNLTLYIMAGFERHESLLGRLGKYRTGKSCLYVKRLADIGANDTYQIGVAGQGGFSEGAVGPDGIPAKNGKQP